LGRMGEAIALRLQAAGHDLAVYNRTAAKAKALADGGASVVGSPAEAAAGREVVFTCLADDASLAEICEGAGLIEARSTLEGIEGIRFVYFSRDDVIRHPLVQEIIDAYERLEEERRI